MKRIYCTLLLCMAFPFFVGAEKLTQTFKDVPLTEALLGIEKQQETYRIHFVYNDLENYRVTTRIHQLRTRDAVLAVCENLPVKVWGKGKDIFVESLERSKEENTKTAPTNPFAPEKTTELKEIDVNASLTLYPFVQQGKVNPEYPGGNDALRKFIRGNLNLPSGVKKRQEVLVSILVNPDSTIRFNHIVRPGNCKPTMVREIKKTIKRMPQKWIPGGTLRPDGTIEAERMFLEIPFVFDPTRRFGADGTYVEVKTPGTLSSLLTEAQKDTCKAVIVSGKLNSADIRTLRHMAGYEEEGCRTRQLRYLDLSNTETVSDTSPYLVLENAEEEFAMHSQAVSFPQSLWDSDYRVSGFMERNGMSTDFRWPGPGGSGSASTYHMHIELNRHHQGVTWKEISKERMRRFEGHRMEWDGEHITLKSHLRRKYFCLDMFYKCPSLKYLIIPYNARISERVVVFNDSIYYTR